MSPFTVSPKNIWNFRQNKASLIVRDIVGEDADTEDKIGIYKILLARGVFKWFAVRRQIISLKNKWKERVKSSLDVQKQAGAWGHWHLVWYYKGYRRALEECRAEIRELCHSDRWSVDPKDSRAAHWLYSVTPKIEEAGMPETLPEEPQVSL